MTTATSTARFYVEFIGRRIGAIGITEQQNMEVDADDLPSALTKIYETYEHISQPFFTDRTTGYSYRGFGFQQVLG